MAEAVVVSAVRTPIGRANKGVLKDVRADDLAAIAVKGALERVPQLDRSLVEDVILGCAFPEGEQGMNLARLVGALAGLPETAAGVTVNRFCASSLQALIWLHKISCWGWAMPSSRAVSRACHVCRWAALIPASIRAW